MMKKLLLIITLALSSTLFTACSNANKVADGKVVKIKYTGTLSDGKVFDSTQDKQPLTFLMGSKQLLPAFESAINGLAQGAKKKFTLSAKDAYGEADPKKVAVLPRDGRFQDGVELKPGAVVFANRPGPNGKNVQFPVKVVKVDDKEVTIDYNHPLAGQDLTFDVEVVEVLDAPKAQEAPAQVVKKAPADKSHG